MKFAEITEHLGKRGFVTREKWHDLYVAFGMDNVWYRYKKDSHDYYIPCLDDMWADDWVALDLFWNGSKDNDLPFRSS